MGIFRFVEILHQNIAIFVKEFLTVEVREIWWFDSNFEESYLSEFLRYGLRKKCVRKPLMHTFQKLTCRVHQNILRATSKGFVLKLHFSTILYWNGAPWPQPMGGMSIWVFWGYYKVANMTTRYVWAILMIYSEFYRRNLIFRFFEILHENMPIFVREFLKGNVIYRLKLWNELSRRVLVIWHSETVRLKGLDV